MLEPNDFVEIEYTGKLADNKVFDTTDEKLAKENHLHNKNALYGPIIICVGLGHVLPGLDEELLKHKEGDKFELTLTANKGFGNKDPSKIKLIPERNFKTQKVKVHPGMQVNIDNHLGIIIRATSGRVMVDFNHPLAGKELKYEVKIGKKITERKLKVKAFLERTFSLPVKIEGDKPIQAKLPFDVPEEVGKTIKEKIKEITGEDVEFKKEAVEQKSG